MTAPLLAIEDIHAAYQSGVDILQGMSLDVPLGGFVLVIGPNGAGKSTLLKTVFGLLGPHRGAITLDGKPIAGLPPHEVKRLGVSYVPQELNTFPHLTVEENLRVGGWTIRKDAARLKRRIAQVYEIFPVLAERRRDKAGSLSGGQGRMLSVAREMITEPRLMLVDEPTVGLAPNLADQVYELLQTARKAIPTTILLVDQNVSDALRHAEAVVMMNLGKVKAAGPVAEFGEDRVRDLIQECLLG
ncbi:branched-chain amino acid transport system ATP-binding protein [Enhydrobacter aerosaccus]|uniref:Branched-chain amino acid transport system ATP-binding protein n=1 Tax=Enhydrobacter aerosaccus TaxID=225324 RepID=A0A1T4TFX9_9HYPH|nr:ABC transporter ATP-binding protein [Enhydrobacter aerosaccus]SKA39347.1 branched-chain amino acid transport system ATP-binding protein [Enhydrobacter aerosaccus]